MATAKSTTSSRDGIALIPSQSSEVLDSRQLKIRDFRPTKRLLAGTEPARRPSLHLQGHWLAQAGFPIGANVRVQVTPRRLVVELVECDSGGSELRASRPRQTHAHLTELV